MTGKGTVVLDLAPGENNPRNSEGAFITRKDGAILFIYSRYKGASARDEATADLAACRSTDGGKTWSEPQIFLTTEEHGARNIMSVSLLRMQNGDIGLFYLIRKGWHDTRLHLRRSSDDGETWGEARCCVPWPGYHVTNNDRVIRLTGGRLLIPSGYHHTTHNPDEAGCKTNECAEAHFFYSDDDGETWKESVNAVGYPVKYNPAGLQEPGVLELSPGHIWGWGRTELGRQYEWFSRDNGVTWSQPEPSYFTAPCSPLSVKRCPDGKLLAVWNPIPEHQTQVISKWGWGRTPLVYSLSADNGVTWEAPVVLEDDAESGYCYTAIHFTGDAVLLGYCSGGSGVVCLSQVRIRRIEL